MRFTHMHIDNIIVLDLLYNKSSKTSFIRHLSACRTNYSGNYNISNELNESVGALNPYDIKCQYTIIFQVQCS